MHWHAPVHARAGPPSRPTAVSPPGAQVSRLPAELTARWDKARRFGEAWAWVRRLRPGAALTSLSVPLGEAQGAYDALDAAATLVAEITYP